nr:retrovirus-related Pol polyprotein from transposon TNT 1-94 [Tanacetum cinerariifolium]
MVSSLELSQLFYADDVTFIRQWGESNIITIVHALDCFHKASVTRMNLQKSKLLGIAVDDEKVSRAVMKMGCCTLKMPFSYLGIKVDGMMTRIKSWDDIVVKLHSWLSKWKLKTLSIGGHLTLLKSVFGSTPIYYMSMLKVPSQALKCLEDIRRQFFNGTDPKAKRCRGNSLWTRFIKALYGNSGSIETPSKVAYSSTWLNIVNKFSMLKNQGMDLFSFMKKKVSDGQDTLFWEEITVAAKLNHNVLGFSLRQAPRDRVEMKQLTDLIAIFEGVELPAMHDRWIWSFVFAGEFSVASARKFIDDHRLIGSPHKTRWVKVVVSASKLPILNPNEFDLWKMRIEQYFLMADYSLWEVILNGDSPVPTRIIKGTLQPVAPTTAEQKLARKNELKAHAIEKRFRGNTKTKKVQKTLLKQQYENFTGSSSESLDQIHDWLQKLTHTLIWRNKADLEEQSLDDLFNNLKIYEAEVKHYSSTGTTTQNLAFVFSSHTDSTTESLSAAASVSTVCAKIHVSSLPNVDSLSKAVIYSFFTSQSTSPQLDTKDLKQIDVDDLEEMDLRWQMAMLTMRARRFLQKTCKNLGANGPTSMGFDMFKVECYNCHRKGHFDRECRSSKDSRRTAAAEPQRRTVPVETSTSNALVSQCDGVGSYDWSYQAEEEPANYALIAFSSSSSSNNKVPFCSKDYSKAYAQLHSQYDKLTDDFLKSQFDVISYQTESNCESWPHSFLYDRFQPSGGYHDVPPPSTGTFMLPKPDLVFHTAPIAVETDHSAFTVQLSPTKPAQNLSHTNRPAAPIIEDWVSDSEDESKTKAPQIVPSFFQSSKQVKTPRHFVQQVETAISATTPKPASPKSNSSGKRRNRKAYFVCKSVDHLIKDCDYHAKKMAQPTPRNYAHRGNHKQYASLTHTNLQKHMAPVVVLTQSKPVSITAVRPVSAVVPKIKVTRPRLAKPSVTKSKSPIRRNLTRSHSLNTSNSPPRVTAVQAQVVSAAKGMQGKWEWRPKFPILDHGNPQYALKDKGVIDSGCSRHMIGNMSYLFNFEELNGGYVAFEGNPKGGKISGKGKIKTGKLDFDNVYFVKELKFNLFSVSQMENNMYNVNLNNIVPSGDLTCLFAKATIDESNLWHRRLAHINFKTLNKLVNGNLVRGLPIKVFENDNTCVACKKGKQHRASCKTKPVSSVDQPLYRLHMDLFGPTFVKSLNKKSYCLVITDDYSRFTWVFFLATKDETSPILKTFITGLENQLSLKVKVIRSDNRTEFKNNDLNQFCEIKGIKREFSVPRTPQQNGIVKRKNKTLIEAARTILADSLLPIPFWAEAVNTACYVQNRPESEVSVSPSSSAQLRKQDDKTKKEAKGKSPVESFTRYRDLSTYVAGPSNAAASPTYGKSSFIYASQLPNDPDMLELEDITYSDDEDDVGAEADFNNMETSIIVSPIPTTRVHKDHSVSQIIGDLSSTTQTRSMTRVIQDQGRLSQMFNDDFHTCMFACFLSQEEPKMVHQALKDPSWIEAMQEELLPFKMQKVWVLVDLPHGKRVVGHTQEEGIDYEEVFAPVARIKAIRLFLAYASFMGFMVYQMDVNNAFLYGTIEEEVYVCQPLGFEDPDHPDKVYKVVKVLYGLHQAPRAWYETLANYLLENAFQRGKIDQTLFIKKQKGDIRLVQIYVDDIIFGATNKDLCKSFEKLMKDKFQMSSMGELTFFLGLQVKQKKDGIFISQDKHVAEILRKFGLTEGKSASTPIDTEKPLLKDPDGEDVDVYTYRIFRYLKGKPYLGLWYSKDLPFDLVAYSDSDYAGDVSTHTTKYASPTLTQKVFANLRRVGKGFYEVETPLFEGMLVEHQGDAKGDADEHVEEVNTCDAAEGDDSAGHGEVSTIAEEQSIPSPTPTIPPPQPPQDIPSTSQVQQTLPQSPQRVDTSDDIVMDDESNQGRMIADMDKDDADKDDVVVLMDDKEDDKKVEEAKVDESAQEDETEPTEVQEVVDVVTTAKLIIEVVTASSETVTAASIIIPTVEPQVSAATINAAPARVTAAPSRRRKGVVIRDHEEESATSAIIPVETKSKDKGKRILVEEPKPLKKKQQIEQDVQYARKLHDELNKDIDWDEAIDHVKLKAKEDPAVKRYQAMKRKPQTEAQARKNMMMYLKNVAGFKLDYFNEMSYDDIRPIFEAKFNSNVDFLLKTKEKMEEEENRALQTINETPAEKAAKRRKLNEKVPVVDYEIIEMNNKPYYKIIIADGSHQLYISFLTLLRNFDREDLEALWSLVKERFSTAKPKNFFDDFLLTTLGAMFEKPDTHAQIWKNQRTIHGQELEATGIMWCAKHNLYNHTADFVSGKEIPTLKIYSRPNAECSNHIYNNTVDFAGREEISTHKVHSGSDAK